MVPKFATDLALDSTNTRRLSRSTSLPSFPHERSDARHQTAPAAPQKSSAALQIPTSGGTQVLPDLAVSAETRQQNASEEQEESDTSPSKTHQPFVSDAAGHREENRTSLLDEMNTRSADSSEVSVKSSVVIGVDGKAELARKKGSADVLETDAVSRQRLPQPDETDEPPRRRSPMRASRREYDMHETAERIFESPSMAPTHDSLLGHDRWQESDNPKKTAQMMIEWPEPDPKPDPKSESKPESQSRPQDNSEQHPPPPPPPPPHSHVLPFHGAGVTIPRIEQYGSPPSHLPAQRL